MITKILRNATLGLIFVIPFIPLYVPNSLFFPFITGKAFAFRIIVEIIVALWLLLLLRDKKVAPKFSWLSLGITLFVIVAFITDLTGLNPLRSLWSNFERMEGWVTIAHLWAYFIVVTSMFGSGAEGKRMWENFFKTTLAAAAIVGIYGFSQLFGWAEIHQGSSRIDASLGNAAYMAVYMLVHAFIAWYMALSVFTKKRTAAFWGYTILGIVFAFLLFETATRGTILGLVGGIMLALGLHAIFGKGEAAKTRWMCASAIIVIILLGAGLVAAKNTSFVKNSESLNRLASISISDTTTQARAYIWPMAIKSIFSSPKTAILGIGQENFNYIFNANYNPKMWSQEQWFDRAHSVFLDWLVAGGLLDLLLYCSLFILALVTFWKSSLLFREKCLLTGLFAAYAIHSIFVFDNLASYLLFFTILGFVHSSNAVKPLKWLERKDSQSENAVIVRDYIFFPVIVIVFVAALYLINIRPIQANIRLISAMTNCGGGTVTPAPEAFEHALALNEYMANQEIREQLLSCSANVIGSNLPVTLKKDFYDLTVREIKNQAAASPEDARGFTLAGVFYNNISDWQEGTPFLEKAHELSPAKQSISFELAKNYLNTGKEKEAALLMQQAYEASPDNTNAKLGYISALIISGQDAKAHELFGNTPEIFLDPNIINAYAALKQYQKVIASYKQLITLHPEMVEYYGSLTAAYFQNKQYADALAELAVMKVKFPERKSQIDTAIAQVKQSMAQ